MILEIILGIFLLISAVIAHYAAKGYNKRVGVD
jgi:hypothetical protein